MGLTSLQVCMDTSDWLQGTIPDDNGMDSSSSPSGDILTCSRPLVERRLRPPHDLSLKCPRCDSTHTKFCYYNNYSLTQPRYFCKTCRRYWTKGGTLRNIPVGGGCRKNKKVSNSKKTSPNDHQSNTQNFGGSSSLSSSPSDLRLSYPDAAAAAQFSHLTNLFGNNNIGGGGLENFRYNNAILDQNPRAIHDFMESKYDFLGGNSRNHDFMGNGEMGMNLIGGVGDMSGNIGLGHNFHGLSSPFGNSLDGNTSSGHFMDSQRLMLPYEGNEIQQNGIDVKPNMTKLLALDWQDQGCSDLGKDSFGYNINGLGSWSGMMNGYGPPATNP